MSRLRGYIGWRCRRWPRQLRACSAQRGASSAIRAGRPRRPAPLSLLGSGCRPVCRTAFHPASSRLRAEPRICFVRRDPDRFRAAQNPRGRASRAAFAFRSDARHTDRSAANDADAETVPQTKKPCYTKTFHIRSNILPVAQPGNSRRASIIANRPCHLDRNNRRNAA